MARYVDYDKLHDGMYEEIFPKYIETSPNRDELWRMFCAMMNHIEVQDAVTDWDERKKLLQPKASNFDWTMFHDIVNAAVDFMQCNAHDGKKHDWNEAFRDWLADYMYDYSIDPSEILMEEPKDE